MVQKIFLWFVLCLLTFPIVGQGGAPVTCGTIIDGEFTDDLQVHDYIVDLSAGDSLTVQGQRFGEGLQFSMILLGPTGVTILRTNSGYNRIDPLIETSALGASGTYTFRVSNAGFNTDGTIWVAEGGIGLYTLYIGCSLRDGTVIEPGDVAPPPIIDPSSTLSLFDYLGLSDLIANGVVIPLQADVPNAGSIATGFDGVFGYSFAAEAGQNMSLDFARTGGNLNLGVVLLSADNQVAFQASLVTSNTFSTELVIPASGDYTLGVFRIELIPPDAPENTTFTLSASLN